MMDNPKSISTWEWSFNSKTILKQFYIHVSFLSSTLVAVYQLSMIELESKPVMLQHQKKIMYL